MKSRQIHIGATIDPDHPLVELLRGIGPTRTLLRALVGALLDGLASREPDLADVARQLVAIVKADKVVACGEASNLPINKVTDALVLLLRAQVAALGKVEHALRRDYRATPDPEETPIPEGRD